MWQAIIITVIILAGIVLYSFKSKPNKWIVYYGQQIQINDLKNVSLAILEPDHINPKQELDKSSSKFIAYLSVGEVNASRSYWADIKEKSFVLGPNPNWPDAYRIDIRSKAWQDLLIDKLIPEFITKGYKGIFLDTVDTAIYLENSDPSHYKGSKKAMVDFIKRIRNTYPKFIIIPNNGLEILNQLGNTINGVVVEDLYTRYDFANKTSVKTPVQDTIYKEKYLDIFKEAYNKPIYNILYASSIHSEAAKYGIKASKRKGYEWYLTSVDLMSLGTTQ
jgi:polysaccharide biosynthesis protein PelA